MKITAGILAFNNFFTTTKLLLDSLLAQTKNNNHIDVIVLDNGSTDDSLYHLKEYLKINPFFSLKISQKNLGFAGGFNKIFSESSGEWNLIISSDTEFPKYSINNMIMGLEKCSKQQKILCPITNSSGNAQHIYFDTDDKKIILDKIPNLTKQGSGELMEIYRADFFCVAIRSDLWDLLKGISEDFGMGYYEDFDFCLRAKSKGYNPYLYEKWFIYHQGSASFGANKKDLSLLLKKNKRVLKDKHKIIEFRHRRNDILLFLIKHSSKLINNHFLTKLRIEYLQHDLPRSPFKKILWKIKIKLLIHYHLKIV